MTETVNVEAAEEAHHPSDWEYAKIALWLAFFTAIEVGAFFLEQNTATPEWVLYAVLTILMIIKFVAVGAYFMHLKYDSPMFRQFFLFGIVGSILVFMVVLLSYNYFGFA